MTFYLNDGGNIVEVKLEYGIDEIKDSDQPQDLISAIESEISGTIVAYSIKSSVDITHISNDAGTWKIVDDDDMPVDDPNDFSGQDYEGSYDASGVNSIEASGGGGDKGGPKKLERDSSDEPQTASAKASTEENDTNEPDGESIPQGRIIDDLFVERSMKSSNENVEEEDDLFTFDAAPDLPSPSWIDSIEEEETNDDSAANWMSSIEQDATENDEGMFSENENNQDNDDFGGEDIPLDW